ncbi:MAG: GFA family protein [Pseudomonadota bacterium]
MTTPVVTGGCNCGGVQFSITGPLRSVVACHCGQCRKQTGLYYAATDVADDQLTFESDSTLKWYAASDEAKRGFCGACGSALFWKANGSEKTSILVGSLDGDAGGIKLERHIFTADKGAFYELNDGLPCYAQGDSHDPRPERGS